ncbi:DNA translocase FtsK [Pediococcus acidilactici]
MVKYDGPAFFRKKGLKMDDHSVKQPTDSAESLKSDHPFTPAIQQKLAQRQAPDAEPNGFKNEVEDSTRLKPDSTSSTGSRPVRRFRLPISNYELTRRPLPKSNQAKRQLTSRQELNDSSFDEPEINNSDAVTPVGAQKDFLSSAAPIASKTKPTAQVGSSSAAIAPVSSQQAVKSAVPVSAGTKSDFQPMAAPQKFNNPKGTLQKSARTVSAPPVSIAQESTKQLMGYHFPSLDLLPDPVVQDGAEDQWVADQAQRLDDALSAFEVAAKVVNWTVGPTVTQFEIELGRGVKVNKITNLTDDLKLQLAARDIRIEAPIPGKNTVGIEIPNPHPRPVPLSEIIKSPVFQESKSPLTIALGVDLFGKPQVYDLRKMPHGLIAGATGSGKSVFINSVLVSLLYKATPQMLKLLLIDPKAVEMAPYNRLPHLLAPVISDPQAAAAALKWVTNEMDQRYERLAAAGARNLEQFNEKARQAGDDANQMPYIVVIIDELADLMMVSATEVQDYIVRITQKARAAGIHLLIATQRPSVDVVTGLIKNNIPTRVAFMVSSQVDSRTILDQSGAERLLGRGDMLFLGNGKSNPVRLQGAFISDAIDTIADFVREQAAPHYAFNPTELKERSAELDSTDELMDDVLEYIAQEDTISTSKLQRVFSIGYNRAATIIDQLEESGYVSASRGSKPREVFYRPEENDD